MIKTFTPETTPNNLGTSKKINTNQIEDINLKSLPSKQTIQNILNFSKAYEAIPSSQIQFIEIVKN